MINEPNQEKLKTAIFQTKISLYTSVAWGIICLFFLIGIVSGKDNAAYGIIILCLSWTVSEIVKNMFLSLRLLKLIKEMNGDGES